MDMRLATGAIAVIIAGCAGTPAAPGPTPIAVASQPTAATSTAAASASGDAPLTDADVQRITHAKKLGLTVVTVKGEVLYCRTERKTGSHLATETNCLTQEQLDDLHEQTGRDMDNFRRSQLPKPAN
jgi:hypothetical protein